MVIEPAGGRTAVDVDAVVAQARYAGLPLAVTILGLLALTLDGFDIQAVAFAAPALAEQWQINRAALGPVLAAGLIGMAVGAVVLGRVADVRGRRFALILSTVLYAGGSFATAAVHGLTALTVWRFLTGIGLGAPLAIATAMINEFTPPRWRSVSVAAAVVGIPLGGVAGSALAAELVPRFGWPSIFIAGGVLPLLLAAALALWFPESPKFLATRPTRHAQLARLLGRVSGQRYDAATRFFSGEDTAQRRGVTELLAPALRRVTLTLWLAFLCNVFAVYVFFNWLPTVLGSVGMPVREAIRGALIFNIGGVLGALSGAALVNALGSRRVTVVLGTVSVLATALIGQHAVFGSASAGAATADGALTLLMAMAGFGISGTQTLLYVLAAHAFPTTLRATGVGSCGAIGRCGGILSTGAGSVMFALGLSGGRFFSGLALCMVPTIVAMLLFTRHIHKLRP